MIITCPRCFATYNVPDTLIQGGGRKVRCSSCRFEWSETPPPQDAIAALAPEPAPAVPDEAVDFARAVEQAAPAVAAAPKVRRARPPAEPSKLGPMLVWFLFIMVTLTSALVLLREPLGKSAHFMTDFYELIGLPVEGPNDWFRFEDIKLERGEADGQTVLVVRGRIVNQSRRLREVPELKLFWREKSGHIGPLTLLQANPREIAPEEDARFNGELVGVDASGGGEVKVTFVAPGEQPGESETPPAEADSEPAHPQPGPAPAPAEHPEEPAHETAPAPDHNNGH